METTNKELRNANDLLQAMIEIKPAFAEDYRVWESYGKVRVYNGKKYYELRAGKIYTNHTAWVLDIRDAGYDCESL